MEYGHGFNIKTNNYNSSKHWVFTIKNPSVEYDVPPMDGIEYMIIGKKASYTSCFPTYDGYVVFKQRERRLDVQTLLPRADIKIYAGTPEDAISYCKEQDDYGEWGERLIKKTGSSELRQSYVPDHGILSIPTQVDGTEKHGKKNTYYWDTTNGYFKRDFNSNALNRN